MTFVVDSSVALTWCFAEERTPETAALLASVTHFGGFAPSLWPLEVLNGLWVAERRKRIDRAKRCTLIDTLAALPIKLDPETAAQAWAVTARLAQQHGLTLYDAAYLELAQRLELPLATLDVQLRAAADAVGVPLLGAPGDSDGT